MGIAAEYETRTPVHSYWSRNIIAAQRALSKANVNNIIVEIIKK